MSQRKDFLATGMGALGALAAVPAMAQAIGTNAMPLPPGDRSAAPDMKRVLDALLNFNAPPFRTTIPRVARELPSFRNAVDVVLTEDRKPCVEAVGTVAHRIIAGPDGPLLLRIYVPEGRGPFPVIVYFHGGGWVIANLDTYDATPRSLANGARAIVVSVAYRQAPEFFFPSAPRDALAAYEYVLANAPSMNGNPSKIAIAGESAGGNLAAGVTLQAKAKGIKQPVFQLLVYPVATFGGPPTASFIKYTDTIPLAAPDLPWFTKYYLPDAAAGESPYASISKARSYKGLPPALIVNAEIDPLRDDGAVYAERLQSGGVKVRRNLYTGVTHEFFGMGAVVGTARRAMGDAVEALERAFAEAT